MEGIELPERDFLRVRLHKRISAPAKGATISGGGKRCSLRDGISARGIGDLISDIFILAIFIERRISAIGGRTILAFL